VFVVLVAASVVVSLGCRSHNEASARDSTGSTETAGPSLTSAQALRTCVDRWNQANMIGWGPALVRISVRRLDATELAAVGLRNPKRPRCVVSFALESRADPQSADQSGTFDCAINPLGAYNCPLIHEPLGPPLRNKNGTTGERGVLKLDAPLKGTRATRPLAWQRYPHRDGFIEPWTRAGKLRPGLSFASSGHGPCGGGHEATFGKSGVRCIAPAGATFAPEGAIFGPCYPSRRGFRRGDVAACTNGPGDTSFMRWTISRR
jgi:hypothetical protein